MKYKVFFKNTKVLITGHTGFKGSWLTAWLESLGAKVIGVALDQPSQPSHFEVADLAKSIEDHRLDIRDGVELKRLVLGTQPDFVLCRTTDEIETDAAGGPDSDTPKSPTTSPGSVEAEMILFRSFKGF